MSTYDEHLSPDIAPEYARFVIPIQYTAARGAGNAFLYFVADIDYEVVDYVPFSQTASGTVTFDLQADGVSLLSTKPTCTALTPVVAAVFSTTRISQGQLVKGLVDAASAATAGTAMHGILVLRPLLGAERLEGIT